MLKLTRYREKPNPKVMKKNLHVFKCPCGYWAIREKHIESCSVKCSKIRQLKITRDWHREKRYQKKLKKNGGKIDLTLWCK